MMIVMVKMRTMKKKTEKAKKKIITGGGDYKERERERGSGILASAESCTPAIKKKR